MSIQAPTPNLVLAFDINQLNSQLQFSMAGAVPSEGKHSGAVALSRGDSLQMAITGYGPGGAFSGFEVLECYVVTVPLLSRLEQWRPTYSAPTPFAGVPNTAAQLVAFGAVGEPSETRGTLGYTAVANRQLKIGAADGRWEMTFVVTVRIQDGSAGGLVRVFTIDPETQVGDGTGAGNES